MGILSWIVLGGIAGWLASIVTKRNDRMGCITNILAGVVGAFVGGWVFSFFGRRQRDRFQPGPACLWRLWVRSSCWEFSTFSHERNRLTSIFDQGCLEFRAAFLHER